MADFSRNKAIILGLATKVTATTLDAAGSTALTGIVNIIDSKPQGGALNYDLKKIQDLLFIAYP